MTDMTEVILRVINRGSIKGVRCRCVTKESLRLWISSKPCLHALEGISLHIVNNNKHFQKIYLCVTCA